MIVTHWQMDGCARNQLGCEIQEIVAHPAPESAQPPNLVINHLYETQPSVRYETRCLVTTLPPGAKDGAARLNAWACLEPVRRLHATCGSHTCNSMPKGKLGQLCKHGKYLPTRLST